MVAGLFNKDMLCGVGRDPAAGRGVHGTSVARLQEGTNETRPLPRKKKKNSYKP